MAKKIVINTESYANEQTLTEVMQAVAQANANNSAEVVRDANGKVVRVMVNLPEDTSNEGLETAKAAISANSGVASVISFPIGTGIANDFESFTEGQDVKAATLDLGGVKGQLSFYNGAATATVTATNGIAGKSLVLHASSQSYLTISASLNGVSLISGYEVDFDLSMKGTIKGGTDFFRIDNAMGRYLIRAGVSANLGKWVYSPNIPANDVDTGETVNGTFHCKFKVDEVGNVLIQIGNYTLSAPNTNWFPQSSIPINFYRETAGEIVLDNISVKLLSGSV